jgi:hypothetical protein
MAPRKQKKPKIKCRGPRKKDGGPCQHLVSEIDERCPIHLGLPAVPPGRRLTEYANKKPPKKRRPPASTPSPARPAAQVPAGNRSSQSPSSPNRDEIKQKMIDEAVEYCTEAWKEGPLAAAANRAAGYATEEVWNRLTKDWSGRNCKGLARLAELILAGKAWIHEKLGLLAKVLLRMLGVPKIVEVFAGQAISKIPLPIDHKATILARGLQVTGIAVCFLNDKPLNRCECFIDLVLSEGKERVKQLVCDAAVDWVNMSLHLKDESALPDPLPSPLRGPASTTHP